MSQPPPATPPQRPYDPRDEPGGSDPLSRSDWRDQQAGQRAQHNGEVRRAFGLTALSTLLPGLGLIFTRRRGLGILMALAALITFGLVGFSLLSGGVISSAAGFLTARGLLLLLALFVIGGVVWVLGIMLTAQETVRDSWSTRSVWLHRIFAAALCLLIAAPSARGAQYVLITKDAFTRMTEERYAGRGGSARTPDGGSDPWRDVPRVNVLLIGSDAADQRTGVRTDSLMVASIDTKTGDTVLISVPRNLQKVPFPADNPLKKVYPNGFDCGNECLMDAVWEEAATKNRDKFPADEANPGLNTTREVVQEIVGLPIDYTTVVDLSGFTKLVDAMGGVTMNVPTRIPIGGVIRNGYVVPGSITDWIEPGYQRLNGHQALWYSRSRATTSDDDRMRRQRCMVNALVSQSNPFSLLQKFPDIMAVAENNISFDIPQEHLPAFATLVETMQKGTMRSVNLSPPIIKGYDPDYAKIRALVKQATTAPPEKTAPKSTGSPTPTPSTTTTVPPTSSSTTTQAITNTRDSC